MWTFYACDILLLGLELIQQCPSIQFTLLMISFLDVLFVIRKRLEPAVHRIQEAMLYFDALPHYFHTIHVFM